MTFPLHDCNTHTTTRSEPALARPGEVHSKCGEMVAYGELHWTDECKPKTETKK